MTELQMNGNYESYLAQLFNPLAGGSQFNPGIYGAAGIGGVGAGAVPNIAAALQMPQAAQGLGVVSNPWAQQQQQAQTQAQVVAAIQLAQQIAAKQAVQAIQCAQAMQTLLQVVHNQASQQQLAGAQAQHGYGFGGGIGYGQPGQGAAQFGGWGAQNPSSQAQQQQALQQLVQTLAAQQQPAQFRYGLAA
jgi:hypothetical protein